MAAALYFFFMKTIPSITLFSQLIHCGTSKTDVSMSGLVWFITGAGKHLYVRNVGAAPLQRHPMVAVALVCVSVQITAARVAQT